MKTKHQYALRPYHNPQNADESLVPSGWRMLYADEFPMPHRHGTLCRLFVNPNWYKAGAVIKSCEDQHFSKRENATGRITRITYIIPVNA